MGCTNESSIGSTYHFKLSNLESTLHQSLLNVKELSKTFEDLSIESEDYKTKFFTQKECCDSEKCSSAEALKKIINSKDNLIQLIASAITKVYETKDLNLISEVFSILFGETNANVKLELLDSCDKSTINTELKCKVISNLQTKMEIEDTSFKDESLTEIEGTPGRTSPIIHTKKIRNNNTNNSSDFRDKKKCTDNKGPTTENKSVKLVYSTPTGGRSSSRLKQSRLNLVKLNTNTVYDLTSSPEIMEGRGTQSETYTQPLVKKESTDNDETILPSPTSGMPSPSYPSLLKTLPKNSPFKKPPLCLKQKTESKCSLVNQENLKSSPAKKAPKTPEKEDSINLLKPVRFLKELDDSSPKKVAKMDDDETYCPIASSLSILQQVDKLEQNNQSVHKYNSPTKKPLAENINLVNVVPDSSIDSSMSLLRPEPTLLTPVEDKGKRKVADTEESLYKEPTVRKKAEKRALPGWSCEECEHFYDELYKDDPAMLAQKMSECSRHRARRPPARAASPAGFWQPRWHVPADTLEFNRRNDAQ